MKTTIDIVFDRQPSMNQPSRLMHMERKGKKISTGHWIHRSDKTMALRIPDPVATANLIHEATTLLVNGGMKKEGQSYRRLTEIVALLREK